MKKQGKEKKRRGRMRLLAVAMSFCLFVTACPNLPGVVAVHAAVIKTGDCGADGSNVTYSLDDNGTLTISGSGAMMDDLSLKSYWYSMQGTVKRVVIGNGVTKLGDFGNFSVLESIEIPDSVTEFDKTAFYNCKALETIRIPNGMKEITGMTFSGCSALKSVIIPNSVMEIRIQAFYGCTSLTSIEIPNSVTTIGETAFNGSGLKSVTIPGSVSTIGKKAFGSCEALETVVIQEGVKTIDGQAFIWCSSLKSVKIPDSVTTLGESAFYDCSELVSIEIPGNVKVIDSGVFRYCTALENVTLSDGVTGIGSLMFYDCTALENIEIPGSVKTIGGSAFKGCTALETVTIQKGVTEIGREAFKDCAALETVEIPDSVTWISADSFRECSNAVIYYPSTAYASSGWNTNTTASIKYTVTDGKAELFIEKCSDDLDELYLPATVSGYIPVSLNYEDYPDITVTHDGPHSYDEDGICQLCGDISEEKKVADAMEVVLEAMEEIVATNATTQEEIQAILDEALDDAGISRDDVTVIIDDFEKIFAEKYEDGSIEGTVIVVSNQDEDVYDGFEFDLTIDELITDEEMVADAKAFVERVLAGITATNATTGKQIQKIIDEALDDEEYIYDVEIKVGELTKTEADMTAPGSITGTVSIVSENDEDVSASVPVDLTITKLPIPVTGITLDRGSATLTKEGETVQLTVGILPENAENKNVTWSSSDAEVASVDATGKVTAIANGTCTVTATTEDGGKTAVCQITVSLPTKTPEPNKTPGPSESGKPNKTPEPGETSEPGKTPAPNKTPAPDKTPEPGKTNEPDKTPAPDQTNQPFFAHDLPLKITTPKKALESNAAFLYGGLKVRQSGKKIVISWERAAGADGYDVYIQYCGKDFTAKSIKAIRSGATTKTTITKINGKALNLKKHFKVYVSAYKRVDGKKVKIGKTVAAHVAGSKNKNYSNAGTIRVAKSSYSLKKGESAIIRANTVSTSKGKKQLSDAHTKEFRYASDNKSIATVSGTGKIKAVGTGSCTVYVYARNGYAQKVKVTVK